MWIYRAYDEDDFPIAEAYSKERLIDKLKDEFGEEFEPYRIERVFESWLK